MIIFSVLGLICWLNFFDSSHKRFLGYFSFIFFLVLIVFRWNVGYDFSEYVDIFSNYAQDSRQIQRLEILNIWLIALLRHLNADTLGIALYTFLTYVLLNKAFKPIGGFMKISLLWIGVPLFFLASLSTVRQFLALSIAYVFLAYSGNLRFHLKAILFFTAVAIHKSAVLLLPLFVLEKVVNSRMRAVIMAFVIISFGPIFIEVIATVLGVEHLINSRFGFIGGGGKQFWLIILVTLPVFLTRRTESTDRPTNMLIIGLAIYYILLPYGLISTRVFLFFGFYFISLVLSCSFYSRFYPRLALSAFLLVNFYYGIYLGFLQEDHPYLPYNFIFLN